MANQFSWINNNVKDHKGQRAQYDGGFQALKNVNLEIEEGEILALLGPNGAGKSTTMRMIAGVLEPDGGDALIDGKSILTDRREAQRALGYLPEGVVDKAQENDLW